MRVKEDWWSLNGLDRDQIRVICCGVKRKGGREEGGKGRRSRKEEGWGKKEEGERMKVGGGKREE